MGKTLLAIASLAAFGNFCCAQEMITVNENSAWKPANAEQVEALAKEPGLQVLDFSLHTGNGGAFLLKTHAYSAVNHSFIEGSVDGYIQSIEKNGQQILERKDTQIGPLPAVYINSTKDSSKGKIGLVTYLMYSDQDMYSLSVFGEPDLSSSSPMVTDYISRLQFSPSLVAGSTKNSPAFEMGRQAGMITGKIMRNSVRIALFALPLIGILGLVIFLALRTRRPPL